MLDAGPPVDVTARRSRTRRPGIAIHRAHALHKEDRDSHEGIPVTSVARTLLDLAGLVVPRPLERAVEEAERLAVFDLRAIERLEARSRGRPGWPLLRATLQSYREPAPTRSELERRFVDLCRDAGLSPPGINAFVIGFELDAVWHDPPADCRARRSRVPSHTAAFERDRVRDAALQLEGYRVLRVTYRRLEAEPAEVVAAVRSLLEMER